ncbi:MAG: hypothetical protein KIPDCIKN_01130 [Haliscomenobacter sp.]|nr:hypothetical protein [Haliscomenobacter sp.]
MIIFRRRTGNEDVKDVKDVEDVEDVEDVKGVEDVKDVDVGFTPVGFVSSLLPNPCSLLPAP